MIYETHFGKFIPNIAQRKLMAIFNGKSNMSDAMLINTFYL